MIVTGVVFLAILLIIEYTLLSKAVDCIIDLFKKVKKSKNNAGSNDAEKDMNSNVEKEKRNVDALTSIDLHFHDLVLRNLTKSYGKFNAVNKISVALKRYNT